MLIEPVPVEIQPAVTRTSSLAVIATDGELLMRFLRHRDQAAFAEVVERHGRLVWLVCQQTLGHHHDVEDAFQATFLILAQRATTIRASDSAAAWLYRVAQRTAVAARRKRSRRREEELVVQPPQGEEALPVIHDRQMLYVLMEELRALPERYQTPLVLRYFEDQSRRAIAEQTDSTIAQIQGRLVRGRRLLRSRLIRRGVSLSLAAGALATASSAASAAVSPSFVAATAASSSLFITSGATGGASPAAVELSQQGLNAMWYASLTKSASIVAGVLLATGILWAAQPGDGTGEGTSGNAAPRGIDLQAVATEVTEAEEPAAVTIAVAAPAKAGTEPSKTVEEVTEAKPLHVRRLEAERDHWLLKAEAYRMKAEIKRAFGLLQVPSGTITEPERKEAQADALLMEAEFKLAEAKAIELDAQLTRPSAGEGAVLPSATLRAAQIMISPAAAPQRTDADVNPTQLAPGDVIRIQARGVHPDEPIDDAYVIEPMGTVALGALYGRVEVAGLTLIEAEDAIKEKLSQKFEPDGLAVQVTLAAKMPADVARSPDRRSPRSSVTLAAKMPADAAPGTTMRNLPRAAPPADGTDFTLARQNQEEFQQAVARQFDRMRQMMMALQQENTELKKQVEEFRKAQPNVDRYNNPVK